MNPPGRRPATVIAGRPLPYRGFVVVLPLLLLACDGGSVTEPLPAHPEVPSLARVTEWVESEPELVQQGEFHYDESGRLQRYEFGLVLRDGGVRVSQRLHYTWGAEGRIVEWLREVLQDDGTYLPTEIQRYDWSPGRLTIESETRNERTGEIQTVQRAATLDAAGRVTTFETDDGRTEYDWSDGDLVEVVSRPHQGVVQRMTLDYGSAWNPLRALPFRPGITTIFYPGPGSARAATRVQNWVDGQTMPAYVATEVSNQVRSDGFLLRRVLDVWNTSLPEDVRTRIVTRFDYVDPPSSP